MTQALYIEDRIQGIEQSLRQLESGRLQSRLDELQRRLDQQRPPQQLLDRIEALEKQLAQANAEGPDYETVPGQLEELRRRDDDLDHRIGSAHEQLDEIWAYRERSDRHAHDLKHRIDQLGQKFDPVAERFVEFESRFQEFENQFQQLRDDWNNKQSALENRLQQFQSQLDRQQDTLDASRRQVDECQAQSHQTAEALKTQQTKVEQCIQTCDDNQTAVRNCRSTLDDVQRQLTDQRQQMTQQGEKFDQQVQDWNSWKEKSQQKTDELQDTARQHQVQLNHGNQRLEAVEGLVQGNTELGQRLDQQHQQLLQRIDQWRNGVDRQEAQMDQFQQEIRRHVDPLAQHIQEIENRVIPLVELSGRLEEIPNWSAQLENLSNDLDHLREYVEDLESRQPQQDQDEHGQQLQALHQLIQKINQQHASLSDQVQQKAEQESLEALEHKVSQLDDDCKSQFEKVALTESVDERVGELWQLFTGMKEKTGSLEQLHQTVDQHGHRLEDHGKKLEKWADDRQQQHEKLVSFEHEIKRVDQRAVDFQQRFEPSLLAIPELQQLAQQHNQRVDRLAETVEPLYQQNLDLKEHSNRLEHRVDHLETGQADWKNSERGLLEKQTDHHARLSTMERQVEGLGKKPEPVKVEDRSADTGKIKSLQQQFNKWRRNWRWTFWLTLLIAIPGTLWAARAWPTPHLRAQSLTLMTNQGNAFLTAGGDQTSAGLTLWDEKGQARSQWTIDPANGFTQLELTGGRPDVSVVFQAHESAESLWKGGPAGASISMSARGGQAQWNIVNSNQVPLLQARNSAHGGILSLHDATGVTRCGMAVTDRGVAVNLFDADARRRVVLGERAEGPALAILDEPGNPRAVVGTRGDDPIINLHDRTGRQRAVVTTDSQGPRLEFLDEAGKPVYEARPDDEAKTASAE